MHIGLAKLDIMNKAMHMACRASVISVVRVQYPV